VSAQVDDEHKSNAAKPEDAICAVVVLGIATLILVGALGIPNSSYSNAVLSPRDFPWLIGVLLAIAGAVMLLRNVSALLPNRTRSTKADGATEDVSGPGNTAQNPRTLGILLALLLGYILVFVWLGYVLSTFLFLLGATMVLAPRKPVRNVIFAAGLSTIVYFVFTVGLNVLLPPGPLGGLI